ncbi:hypothetical protein JXB27_00930 [Candidatus Woesearchaeota archaeon]|nr:hypothetical protein [Candidatus Woesearchaeota archaeon]
MRPTNREELLEIVSRQFICSKRCRDLVSLTCDEQSDISAELVVSSAKTENVIAVASILENMKDSGAYIQIHSELRRRGQKTSFGRFAEEYARQAFIYGIPNTREDRQRLLRETKKEIVGLSKKETESVEEEYRAIEGLPSLKPRYAN